ncbi:hypothetical protein H072_3129 [Dactylellina haptotyla CBS 200.50]|uniref:Uncharacterized protein n=1 Tax=Dactylellina haptotyla (strain CBS 200.50) TaxID=1284197 RepID=S8C523_DACHA|nr:hypothetical protein H072_3129 [Dactylellina haptotyla CBS 200.50]
MSEFRFRVPNFTRPTPPSLAEDHSAASPTSSNAYSNAMKSKFRITQFVRESKHVDPKSSVSGDDGPTKRPSISVHTLNTPLTASSTTTPVSAITNSAAASAAPAVAAVNVAAPPAPAEGVKSEHPGASRSSDASSPRTGSKDAAPSAGPPLAPKPVLAIRETTPTSISKAKQARRSLPNLKLVPPTHFNPSLPYPDGRTPPPIDPSRSVEWNKVVRSIQATSLEAIVTKLLDALSDRPESGPGTLVTHLGDIFLDDATKQMYRQVRAMDPRLGSIVSSSSTAPPSAINGMTPSSEMSTPIPHSSVSRLPTPASTQRRSLSGAIPRPTPGGVLIAPKLFEPREYKPNNARKLKRKSEADKDGVISRLLSAKRNASLGELGNFSTSPDGSLGGEPPVKRKRGRPKGSTKAAIQERESLKMQATAAEQASETLTETTSIVTSSVSPVMEEERLPTGTSIELRASSPSPRPDLATIQAEATA